MVKIDFMRYIYSVGNTFKTLHVIIIRTKRFQWIYNVIFSAEIMLISVLTLSSGQFIKGNTNIKKGCIAQIFSCYWKEPTKFGDIVKYCWSANTR